MNRAQSLILFVAVFAVALVVLCPLGVALAAFGVDRTGLSARGAAGDVWTGRFADARFGRVVLGDMRVGLKPLPLFAGRAEIGANASAGYGRIIAGSSTTGIADVTAKVAVAAAFAPLPVETIDLDAATIVFRGEACERAEGGVHATFDGDVGGLSLSAGMRGTARCERGELVLPLVGQSGMERLTIRVKANGAWTAVVSVQSGDLVLLARLSAAGFQSEQGGQVLKLAGTL